MQAHTEIDIHTTFMWRSVDFLEYWCLAFHLERDSGICQARLSTNCWRFSCLYFPSCHRGAGCHSCEQALQCMVIDSNNTSYKGENGRFKISWGYMVKVTVHNTYLGPPKGSLGLSLFIHIMRGLSDSFFQSSQVSELPIFKMYSQVQRKKLLW